MKSGVVMPRKKGFVKDVTFSIPFGVCDPLLLNVRVIRNNPGFRHEKGFLAL